MIEGSWNAWDIFTGLNPRLSHVQKHELRDIECIFESAFEDLSFHSFLKASD